MPAPAAIATISSFDDIIRNGAYYVDKTRFIKDMVSASRVSVITRPRRFGKTLMLSTLRNFLEMNCENPSDTSRQEELFAGLDVMHDEAFCAGWMGKWPVISITLKDVCGSTFQRACRNLQGLLSQTAMPYEKFIPGSASLSPVLRKQYSQLLDGDGLSREDTFFLLSRGIALLEQCLARHFGKKVILLIDEYDVPLQKARENGFYDDMLDLMRTFFSASLGNTKYLHCAVLTGCLPIAGESVFTGVSDLSAYGISNHTLSTAIGFTEEEGQKVLKDFGLEAHSSEIERFYGGYVFGKTKMYCPWDLMNFCSRCLESQELVFGKYWTETSSNEIIQEFVRYADESRLLMLRDLMSGRTVEAALDESISLAELNQEHSPEQLMSLLYATGYLTRAGETEDGKTILRIPNSEIMDCFRKRIDACFNKSNPAWAQAGAALFEAFVQQKSASAQNILQKNLTAFMSVRDAAGENFYQGFLLGLLGGAVGSSSSRTLLSNREAGDGYADIILFDSALSAGAVLELKRLAPGAGDNSLRKACERALDQIRTRDYTADFDGDIRQITPYGIAFSGRHCMVRREPG